MAETTAGRHVVRGVVCALAGGICWGFSGTCAQLLMDNYGAPAVWITCVRMVIAAVFFLFMTAVKDWRSLIAVFRDRRSLVQIALFAVFGVLLTQLSYLNAIAYTSAGVGTTIEQVGLVLIMLYVCVRARRLPRVREVAGLILALGGMVIIATQGDPGRLAIPPEGLTWGLVSALALAFYTLMPVRVLKKWGAMLVTGLAMLFGGSAASVVVQPWTLDVQLSTGGLAALAAIVLVGTLGAYMLYLQGVNDAGPVKASLLCCVEPVSATILAVVWLHAPVSGWDIAGCAFIVAMIFLVTEREPKPALEGEGAPGVALREGAEAALDDPPLFAGRASVLGYYTSRPATREDFDQVWALLDAGHETFAALGIDEGRKKYPSARRLMHSIKNGTTHVVGDAQGHMIAVFAVSFSPDKNYAGGIEGQWLTQTDAQPQPYAELHWVSVAPAARRRGVGAFILETAERITRRGGRASLRADVYQQNEPIQKLLEKHGYTRCGILSIKDVFGRRKERIAYEKLL
ncbi:MULTISPECIES: GNAT family N-acetyltransferase [Gordonibacter]|uniref:GNAT family N-acetyltransferase n=1 Tax=Gordonibacter faecis TaxID=3047475 RepID=A0ABT7DPT7_9ACTN|nr:MULTISPECIES: GNAT family N-acetyltransferase [unclassified Gordonibacter]MDJ1651559.1 GNAT family N-acetyltransferase [Gordonibacter sp. KGMB12511]